MLKHNRYAAFKIIFLEQLLVSIQHDINLQLINYYPIHSMVLNIFALIKLIANYANCLSLAHTHTRLHARLQCNQRMYTYLNIKQEKKKIDLKNVPKKIYILEYICLYCFTKCFEIILIANFVNNFYCT